jgi:hypothetical protein
MSITRRGLKMQPGVEDSLVDLCRLKPAKLTDKRSDVDLLKNPHPSVERQTVLLRRMLYK